MSDAFDKTAVSPASGTAEGLAIKDDQLLIVPRTLAEPVGGARPEPEEMPAQRVLGVAHELYGNVDRKPLGEQKVIITTEEPVRTFAQGVRSQCRDCKHFDNPDWMKLKRIWDFSGDPAKLRMLNNLRLTADSVRSDDVKDMHVGMDGGYDVEAALNSMGVCHAFTEINNEETIVHPLASCPEHLSSGQPAPMMFAPKDAATDRRINQTYDTIMGQAAGKGNWR